VSLVALAVSGIALADHESGHLVGKDKQKDPPGKPLSKTSLDVENICTPVQYYHDAEDNEVRGKFLEVKSTITNKSGNDNLEPVVIAVDHIQVRGLQFVPYPKKKEWITAGDVESKPVEGVELDPEESSDFVVYIALCGSDAVQDSASALNAEVQVMIKEDDVTLRNFIGNCDDDESNNVYDDNDKLVYDPELDESRIDIEDYSWLSCP
jgi:hypothetical protein